MKGYTPMSAPLVIVTHIVDAYVAFVAKHVLFSRILHVAG